MMTMNSVHVAARAKLNLTLDIVGKKDGCHLIDSLMTSVDLADRILLKKRPDKLCRIVMHGGSTVLPEKNSAQRAGDAFVQAFGVNGADITIYKNIPIGAGMGGSSADAAGAIAGMGRLYGVTDTGAMYALAGSLFGDAPFQLEGGLSRVTGRGECVEPLQDVELYFLVLLPRTRVDTAQAYAAFDEEGLAGSSRTARAKELLMQGNIPWAAESFGNDLFPVSGKLAPEVKEAYLALRSLSPAGVSMTGSGSAVFACFETKELCEWAKSRYRGKCRAFIVKSTCREPLGGKNSNLYGVGYGRTDH